MSKKEETLKKMHEVLKDNFGYNHFREKQDEVIYHLIQKRNAFVIMPTGGGKSLCYQVPAMMMDGVAVVISPLIALMKNQVDLLRGSLTNQSVAHVLNSSLTRKQGRAVKKDLTDRITKLLYVSPEFLVNKDNISFLKTLKVSFFAIDEAHCISEWGHDFRPEYRNIKNYISLVNKNCPIIALTATATKKVQEDIIKNLKIQNTKVFILSFNRPNLFYGIRPKTKDSLKDLIKFIKDEEKDHSGIIYCASRKRVDELTNLLKINNVNTFAYHAGLDKSIRSENQDEFLSGKPSIIVATIAFGMGIDKPDIRFVIHYDIPKSIESYYQETGRAGRDGQLAKCISYYSPSDIERMEKLMQSKNLAEQQKSHQLLYEIVAFAETADCRRKYLLKYFGEDYLLPECSEQGMCDNCANPKKLRDATDNMVIFVDTVAKLKEQHRLRYITEFIRGIKTVSVEKFKHDKHENFGKGKDEDDNYWKSIYKKAITENLVEKEIETFGIIKLTEKSEKFLKNPYPIEVSIDHDYVKYSDSLDAMFGQKTDVMALDNELYQILKNHIESYAKKQEVPAFVFFPSDVSLKDMATHYPTTLESLEKIYGVGKNRAKKYGTPIIEIIKKYVEENDIDVPEEFFLRATPQKSASKIGIIQSIDRQVSLNELAHSRNKSLSEIITEIEQIIESGIRLNLDYYIDSNIDEEHQNITYDYFLDAATDSIDKAYQELQHELNEDEVRLMRIKFILEYGNS